MPIAPQNSMISVKAAISALLRSAYPMPKELCSLGALNGRIAAEDISARMTQPPFAASAMDGYAVKFSDMKVGAALKIIGEAPAGAPFTHQIESGEAVRIFTGGVVPPGADHIIIQEDVQRRGDVITIEAPQTHARNIRAAGIDFKKGDILIKAGERMNPVSAAVLAAANIDKALVYKKPQIALFSNGNELRDPGSALAPGDIINSNHYALSSLINMWGGQAHYIGCAPDDLDAVKHMFSAPHTADIIVPIGGASVGDYDYVKAALRAAGGEILFEKIAVRPGKPTWHGRLGAQLILGLPGNPASAIVTACLFLKPLIAHMSGAANIAASRQALTQTALAENGPRETYLRANLTYGPDARLYVQPAKKQDSSLLRPFLQGQVLIKRAPNARACAAGERVDIVDMF